MVAALILSACTSSTSSMPTIIPELNPILPTALILATPNIQSDKFSDIPNEARVATRLGDPRPPAYWALWNTCAEENRAEQAAANGGRAAGWFLMDDLLEKPGIQLGDFPVESCYDGLELLQGRSVLGQETGVPLYELASLLLAAELNLNLGAETCPIAEEAVTGAHLVLSSVGFNGQGKYELSGEIANAVPRLVELLNGYNRGQLCR
jgi:hypothetical protein